MGSAMIIDFKEVTTGEDWELFARDFLAELGLVIETPPGRGADGGKDLLVSEQLRGKIATTKFNWLVSCKNFACSEKAVSSDDEPSVSDRVRQHGANGFMGFYSTVATSAFVERLRALNADSSLARFEIFDHRKIEAQLLKIGMSKLVARYFPKSCAQLKPIQQLFDEYIPLNCEICGRDVLQNSLSDPSSAIVATAVPIKGSGETPSVHVVCKGKCDEALQSRLYKKGYMTGWEDVTDLLNPMGYLKNFIAYMNILHSSEPKYSKKAHEAQKHIYIALAQCTLREVTEEDHKRILELLPLEGL